MTDREIKERLKCAYTLPASEKENAFIRRYEKRSLQLSAIIKTEFQYMGLKSMPAGIILIALLILATRAEDEEIVWILASFIPVCALIPMVIMSRSERFGMDELEAASRFSLRFIRMVRMFILGIFSISLLLAVGIVLQVTATASVMEQIMLVVFPYLISVYGAMFVTRKWHGKENIFGVLAVCVFSGMLPYVIRPVMVSGLLTSEFYFLTIVLLLVLFIRECMIYVKESENLSWNLC